MRREHMEIDHYAPVMLISDVNQFPEPLLLKLSNYGSKVIMFKLRLIAVAEVKLLATVTIVRTV